MLTETKAKNAKAKDRDYKLSDSGGLYLFVTKAGAKIWRMKYRFSGQEKRLIFGPYPDVPLIEAREKRDAAKKVLRDGRDPGTEKKQQAAAAVVANGHTFEKLARQWYGLQKDQWKPVHAEDVIGSLEKDVFPIIGNLPIRDITAPMVLNDVLRPIEQRPAVETARRVRQRISAVFVYAMSEGIGENDPAAIVRGAMKKPKRGRQPAIIDPEEVRKMLRTIEAMPAHPVTKLAHRLLALTVSRSGAFITTPWTELTDLGDEPIWCMPADRLKLLKEHEDDEARDFFIPLSTQAIDVIEALRGLTGRGKLVFPNSHHAHRPMSENAIGYLINRAGYAGEHCPHGWRTSFSTIMNETYPHDFRIIDLMLGHVPKDKVEGAYNRAAHLKRRRELAQIWADLLMEGLPPAASLLEGRRR